MSRDPDFKITCCLHGDLNLLFYSFFAPVLLAFGGVQSRFNSLKGLGSGPASGNKLLDDKLSGNETNAVTSIQVWRIKAVLEIRVNNELLDWLHIRLKREVANCFRVYIVIAVGVRYISLSSLSYAVTSFT